MYNKLEAINEKSIMSVIDHLYTGVAVLFSDGSIYWNDQLSKIYNIGADCSDANERMRFKVSNLLESRDTKLKINDTIYEITYLNKEKYTMLFFTDKTKQLFAQKEYEEEIRKNIELQSVFERYFDENIWICDHVGNIEYVGRVIAREYGFEQRELVGENVLDLEDKGFFNPSVTRLVMKSEQTEAVVQSSKNGEDRICVGLPVLKKGKLEKIISISRKIAESVEVGNLIVKKRNNKEDDDLLTTKKKSKLISNSLVFRKTLHTAMLSAKTDSTVLLIGESGVGKSTIARMIHDNSSRSDKKFIHINCGSIPADLIDKELYGYVEGAFTGAAKGGAKGHFEMADGGTIFLDEITDLPINQQSKLLNVLQERRIKRVGDVDEYPVDVRFIAASNKNINREIQRGLFRKDLFYRLNVILIKIPSLRERTSDIAYLANEFLARFNKKYSFNKEIEISVLSIICTYAWPGNVRELENLIERLVVTTKEDLITVDDLPPDLMDAEDKNIHVNEIMTLDELRQSIEKQLFIKAKAISKDEKDIAEILKCGQTTVWRKINEYNI